MADFEGATIDDIYEAFAYAETGSSIDRFQPWIRTRGGKRKGSNAYGPVQMLSSFVSGAAKQETEEGRKLIDFTDEELKFIDRYAEHGEKLYRHGKMRGKIPDYDPRFDYGGSGNITDKDKRLYVSTAKKIIKYELKRVGGIKNLKREWRHGPKKYRKGGEDIKYFKKFDKKLRDILDERDVSSMFPDETIMNSVLG